MEVDRELSQQIAQRIGARPDHCWGNAVTALAEGFSELEGAEYVEGWIVQPRSGARLAHGWLELDGHIVDPTPPHWLFHRDYFGALHFDLAELATVLEHYFAHSGQPYVEALPVSWRYRYAQARKSLYNQTANQAWELVKPLSQITDDIRSQIFRIAYGVQVPTDARWQECAQTIYATRRQLAETHQILEEAQQRTAQAVTRSQHISRQCKPTHRSLRKQPFLTPASSV